jgi:predicted Zn-dependent protease
VTGLHREPDAGTFVSELRRIQRLTWARRHTEALAALRALLRRAPSQRGALYLSALNLRLLGQANNALQTLDALERAHPDYSLLFQERGHCHIALGDPARAIESFERAVELNPALASCWAMLARLSGRRIAAPFAAEDAAVGDRRGGQLVLRRRACGSRKSFDELHRQGGKAR